MMRKLSHAVATFVVTVLAIIGVGVGVVAAVQAPTVYGPSWGRFSAAFSGRVYQQRGQMSASYGPLGGAGVSSAFQSTLTLMFGDLSYSNLRGGWVAYVPPAAETVLVAKGVPMRLAVVYAKRGFVGGRVAEVEQDANGFSVFTFGPKRLYGGWYDTRVESNGQEVWIVEASSTSSKSAAEAFIASFQPIG